MEVPMRTRADAFQNPTSECPKGVGLGLRPRGQRELACKTPQIIVLPVLKVLNVFTPGATVLGRGPNTVDEVNEFVEVRLVDTPGRKRAAANGLLGSYAVLVPE